MSFKAVAGRREHRVVQIQTHQEASLSACGKQGQAVSARPEIAVHNRVSGAGL
jgi:hypothetical protein